MKKFLSVISIVLLCIILVGCGQNNAQSRLAIQKLSSSIDKMIVAVKKVDVIDESKIDLSNDLGYYIEENNESRPLFYPKAENEEKRTNLETPTPNRAKNYVENQSNTTGNNRRFYFISKETEDNYGDLYYISDRCVNLISNVKESKDNLLNNCMKTKMLLQKVSDSNMNMSEADLKTMSSYNEVVSSCSDRVSHDTKCSDCVNNIASKKSNLLSNSGSMTADYLKLASDLDNNYRSLDNANLSISQLNNYLHKLLGEETENNPYMARHGYNYEYRNPFAGPNDQMPPRYTEFRQNRDVDERIKRGYTDNQIIENIESSPDDVNKIVHPSHEEDEQIFTNSDINNQPNNEQINHQYIGKDVNNTRDNQPKDSPSNDEINANKSIDEINKEILNKEVIDKEVNDDNINDDILEPDNNHKNQEKNEQNNSLDKDNHNNNKMIDKENELNRKKHFNEIYQKYVKPNRLHEKRSRQLPSPRMYNNLKDNGVKIEKYEQGLSYNGIKEVRV